MKVLLLSTFDEFGGAARAAFRLNKGLQSIGIDSRMYVQNKSSDDVTVEGPHTKIDRAMSLFRSNVDVLFLRLYPKWNNSFFTTALLPDNLLKMAEELNPDIIHLHWVGYGFIRIETLKRINRPIVWTLHDSYAFTGGCHIPFDCTRYRQSCGKCEVLGSSRDLDLSRWIWHRKEKAWQDLNMTVVAPSQWLAENAKSSSLFGSRRIEVIPNGLDMDRYKPINKRTARELLSLPQDKKMVLFGNMSGTSDRNKGFHLLEPALRKLASGGWQDNVELMIFGSSSPVDTPELGLTVHYLGRFFDDYSIALLYSAADVLVVPSVQENLPNTVMESMACGTPCVAFEQGGIPDMIDHRINGFLASPYETEELAKGIVWILADAERWQEISRNARTKAENSFSLEKVARRYANLYAEVISETPVPYKERT